MLSAKLQSSMRARIKKQLASAWLALYASTMLFGQALHALPGCEHHHVGGSQIGDRHGAASRDHAGHDRAWQPSEVALAARESGGPGAQAWSADDERTSSDDCPICRFHSQAQFVAGPATLSSSQPMRDDVAPSHPALIAGERAGLYCSRAPPRV